MLACPWSERVNALSVNPDMAKREDIARMASELTSALDLIQWVIWRVGKHKTTGEWHDWLNEADVLVHSDIGPPL
jgi:hypothetical protein